jgi:hydroxymethylpyrimidine pyrophosphatase-like HAD family hydrolase
MIIACDLDGTLTDGRGVISTQNAAALRRAKERGATCILATSRPSRCLDLPTRQRALFDCIITCDGAERAAPEPTGIHIPLSPSDIDRASRVLKDAHITGAYAVEFGAGLGHEKSYTGWPATDTGVPAQTGSLQELSGRGPVARVFFRPDTQGTAALLAAAAAVTAAAGDSIACSVLEQPESAGLVQFSSRTATKGNAVQAWLVGTGRTGQRLIVFGDQINDLSMLELADDAFAVGDAHPRLRRRYTHLPNADSSAVGREILRMLAPVLEYQGTQDDGRDLT